MTTTSERIRGCLLGGAVGDALGAPVEFDSLDQIRRRFGDQGPADYVPAYERLGAVTDDTQMTMFTVEGLIRAGVRSSLKGICHTPSVVHHAYLRWLETQGQRSSHPLFSESRDGWLFGVQDLHARRAPGNSCLSALHSNAMGTVQDPINNSKGCGGVMRIAPVGFCGDNAFDLGCDIAALTHGHPTGYLAAGFLADVVGSIDGGESLEGAIARARRTLLTHQDCEETLAAVDRAVDLAARGEASPELVETLGAGWIAEEALSISLFCAQVAPDFASAIRLAVTHSGDSDSTGCITGALLGALRGPREIPERWLEALEMRREIEVLAEDLARILAGGGEEDVADDLSERYPGW